MKLFAAVLLSALTLLASDPVKVPLTDLEKQTILRINSEANTFKLNVDNAELTYRNAQLLYNAAIIALRAQHDEAVSKVCAKVDVKPDRVEADCKMEKDFSAVWREAQPEPPKEAPKPEGTK